MYVFKFINKLTGEVIGYNASTFCQVTGKEEAKRYKCTEGWEKTRDTILKNVKAVISGYKEERKHPLAQIFREIEDEVYEEYFKGLTEEDIDVEPEYLTDGITEDEITHKITVIDPETNQITSKVVQNAEEMVNFIEQVINEKMSQKLN